MLSWSYFIKATLIFVCIHSSLNYHFGHCKLFPSKLSEEKYRGKEITGEVHFSFNEIKFFVSNLKYGYLELTEIIIFIWERYSVCCLCQLKSQKPLNRLCKNSSTILYLHSMWEPAALWVFCRLCTQGDVPLGTVRINVSLGYYWHGKWEGRLQALVTEE